MSYGQLRLFFIRNQIQFFVRVIAKIVGASLHHFKTSGFYNRIFFNPHGKFLPVGVNSFLWGVLTPRTGRTKMPLKGLSVRLGRGLF